MAEQRWREKRDRDSKVIPGCWVNEAGYTVAECRLPEKRYTVTRPGGTAPFAYTGSRDEVVRLIDADQQASAQGLVEEGKCA